MKEKETFNVTTENVVTTLFQSRNAMEIVSLLSVDSHEREVLSKYCEQLTQLLKTLLETYSGMQNKRINFKTTATAYVHPSQHLSSCIEYLQKHKYVFGNDDSATQHVLSLILVLMARTNAKRTNE